MNKILNKFKISVQLDKLLIKSTTSKVINQALIKVRIPESSVGSSVGQIRSSVLK